MTCVCYCGWAWNIYMLLCLSSVSRGAVWQSLEERVLVFFTALIMFLGQQSQGFILCRLNCKLVVLKYKISVGMITILLFHLSHVIDWMWKLNGFPSESLLLQQIKCTLLPKYEITQFIRVNQNMTEDFLSAVFSLEVLYVNCIMIKSFIFLYEVCCVFLSVLFLSFVTFLLIYSSIVLPSKLCLHQFTVNPCLLVSSEGLKEMGWEAAVSKSSAAGLGLPVRAHVIWVSCSGFLNSRIQRLMGCFVSSLTDSDFSWETNWELSKWISE